MIQVVIYICHRHNFKNGLKRVSEDMTRAEIAVNSTYMLYDYLSKQDYHKIMMK